MSHTILLKDFDGDYAALDDGEFAIDAAGGMIYVKTGGIDLERQFLPAPDGSAGSTYVKTADGIAVGALDAGGGAREQDGIGTWVAPGITPVGVSNPLINSLHTAVIEIRRPVLVTQMSCMPEFSGGFQFGLRSTPVFEGVTLVADKSGGTHIRSVEVELDPGRYTVFIDPVTPIRFRSINGHTDFSAGVQVVPVFLQVTY